ncbi:PREDICTED: uncharacterized protein LOC106892330 [Calidris pugnax]|uniref:uncharacterized protein LOC106892330 n=1 Tax=Calidris pugnax TaxID=198806 RepID=UPI00071CD83F|nr:PREDICTED: uncharacterized protein LOC106892330 [Calidris pugnax]
MAKPLWKPSRRSQVNLKEQIKERNKKSAGLGKACEPSSTSVSGTISSPAQLKSIQANNRALALALQEEKLKVREAHDAFLLLKGENQCLKFQIFCLQALLQSQQLQNEGMFPSVPVMIPVVTGQEHCAGIPQHTVKLGEIAESKMKATTDDSKPDGFVSEDCCESTSLYAIEEVETECGESFEPSCECLQNVPGTACSHLSTGVTAHERPLPLKHGQRGPRNREA